MVDFSPGFVDEQWYVNESGYARHRNGSSDKRSSCYPRDSLFKLSHFFIQYALRPVPQTKD